MQIKSALLTSIDYESVTKVNSGIKESVNEEIVITICYSSLNVFGTSHTLLRNRSIEFL